MTRKDAINELKTRYLSMSQCLDKEELHKANEALDMAIQALEQTSWIPVSDRLPEKEGNYITTVKSGGFYRVEGESIFEVYGDDITHWAVIGEVIAWMPKPEPYKLEREER